MNLKDGAVAQLGERLPCTEEVRGSNPLSSNYLKLKPVDLFSADYGHKGGTICLILAAKVNDVRLAIQAASI